MENLRYPIGKFDYQEGASAEYRQRLIEEVAATAVNLRRAVEGLTADQLDSEYRPGGWTVRQVVHHVADASMNAFMRAKLALTEQQPVVKPFEENAWVKLPDSAALPVEPSLRMLEGVHERMDALLRSLPSESFALTFMHPENGLTSLDKLVAYFAWHGKHHTAHITSLRQRMGW